MSKRTNRAGYPDYVKFVTRFDAGELQNIAKIPASLIKKARKGEVEKFSQKTLEKFKNVYERYWENRLDRAGIVPDNWGMIIKHNTFKEVREIVRGTEGVKKLDRKLDRGGVNPDEREAILKMVDKPDRSIIKEVEKIVDKNREAAEKIVARRRERDKNLPGYKDSWHSVKDMLEQMARDLSRIASDWVWIGDYGSPERKKAWIPDIKRGRYQH